MRPNRRERAYAASVLLLGVPAYAHNILVSRGQVTVHADHLALRLEVSAHDLLHWYPIPPSKSGTIRPAALLEAADEFGLALMEALVVCDASGRRLPVECPPPLTEWSAGEEVDAEELPRLPIAYTCRFSFEREPALLMMQLRGNVLPAELPWQIVVSTGVQGQSDGPVLTLTSRANVEFSELTWADGRPFLKAAEPRGESACTPCNNGGTRRFKEVCAEWTIEEYTLEVAVYVPVSLLATWAAMPVSEDGWLRSTEQAQALALARDFVRDAVLIQSDDQPLSAGGETGEFISATGSGLSGSVHNSIWSDRVRIRLAFPSATRLNRVSLTWRVFRPGALSIPCLVMSDRRCSDRELSSQSPHVTWQREQQNP